MPVAALPDGVPLWSAYGGRHEGDVRLYHVDGTLVHTFRGTMVSAAGGDA